MKHFKKLFSLQTKKTITGLIFISPFLLGFIAFFAYPFIQAIIFSINELQVTSTGYELSFVGWSNYYQALFVNADFNRILVESATTTLTHIPAIIIFSFFIANVLNQEFKGRLLARLIFFIPVILSSGVIIELEMENIMHEEMVEQVDFMLGGGTAIRSVMNQIKIPQEFMSYIFTIVDQIPEILEQAAIPILIFLAGLQSIPGSLYESAEIDGATGWEKFWKITWPLLTPLFLVNTVYIVVISLTTPRNPLVSFIQDQAWAGGGYSISVAMSMIYFAAIIIMLVIIIGIISKNIYYME